MTHEQAMRLLDAVKDGQVYSIALINRALEITGDRNENDGSSGVVQAVQSESINGWCDSSPQMVVRRF